MAGFYYFFRGRTADELARGEELNHNLLAEYGLTEVLHDVRKVSAHASVSNVNSNAGPGKSCGVVLTVGCKYSGAPAAIGNHPDLQHWAPIDEERGCWIGVLKNSLPRPEDLERFEVIFGGRVADPQHYEWLIPVARCVPQGMPYGTLPQAYRFNAAGEPQPVLDKAWEWLWNLSGEVIDWYRKADSGQNPPESWLIKTAARLLAVNYRLGVHELNLLHDLGRTILHKSTVGKIAQTSYGWEILEEAKKNETLTEAPTAPK